MLERPALVRPTQEQQVDSMLAVVSAQHELAQRLARLRFQSGTLLTDGKLTSRDEVIPARGRK